MNSTRMKRASDLKLLDEKGKKILATILDIMHHEDDTSTHKSQMIEIIAKYPPSLLYALSENSPVVNELLETNKLLNKRWSMILKSSGYPHHAIQSVDKEVSVSLFSQLKGAYLLGQFSDNQNFNDINSFEILNKACEIGMFQALIYRLNFYCEFLSESKRERRDPDEIETRILYILKDAHKLSNLYWSIGSLNAALILLNVADYYFNSPEQALSVERFFLSAKANKLSWLKKYNEKCPDPIEILKTALELLYTAQILSESPKSIKIADEITEREGLFSGFKESFSSEDDLHQLILNKLKNLNIPLPESFDRKALEEAAIAISKSKLT